MFETRSLRHARDVIVALVTRDFHGRYKNTAVGMAWSVISPVLFLLVFYFLFKRVIDLGIPRYASFAFTGIVAWAWFQSSLSQAVTTISSNASLVNQPGFPVASLPIVSVCTNLINFGISLPLLLGILAFEGTSFTWSLLALPLLVITQFLLILSIGYMVAAANVIFRDMQYILTALLQVGFYTTPIFYDLDRVPATMRDYFAWNPLVHLIGGYRDVLRDGVAPDWAALGAVFAVSLVLLMLGYRFFRRASYRFLEEL